MSETYVECLVKQKQSGLHKFLKGLLVAVTVLLVMVMLLFPALSFIAFIIAIVTGVAAYFVGMYTDLEFEYLYLDRELVVDKVMGKTKRKRIGTFSIDRIEILAPVKSYHLDNYKNRKCKEKDYSIGEELKPDLRYAMYYEGGERILLSPSPELIKAMRSVAPRKIFND